MNRIFVILCCCLLLIEWSSSFVSGSNLEIQPTPEKDSYKVSAIISESFVLTCISNGASETKPKGLQWISPDNQAILSDSNRRIYTALYGDTLRLFFDKLVPSDSGTYVCRGIQAGVPIDMRADLVLLKKISFYETQSEQFIKGDTHDQLVTCKASANPGPEIAWFRKGINFEIKNDDKYQITNEGLMIKNAQTEDEGIYYCQASVPSTGELKRMEINVNVMTAPKWVFEPKDTEGVKGDDVIIKCDAFAKPLPVYQWLRNGIPLTGPRFIVNQGTLTVRNLEKEDTATYTCIAENNSGRIESNIKLFVLIGPDIALMEDVRVVEGTKAILRCNVREAFPKATIKWKYSDTNQFLDESTVTSVDTKIRILSDADPDSESLLHSDSQVLDERQTHQRHGSIIVGSWSQLEFSSVTRFDKRNYTCVATNKAAVAERQVQLLVDYAPKLLLNMEAREIYYSWLFTDEFANSGNTGSQAVRSYPVVFTCIADGEPRPLITWYQKGILIKSDNIKYRLLKDEPGMSQLEVNPRSVLDFGEYQCRAENRQGREERTIQLREATPPKFAPIIKLKATNPESVLFDIYQSDAVDADGGMPIEAYRIQWRLSNADWTKPNEKDVPVDLTNIDVITQTQRHVYDVEISSLMPETEYFFRVAAINKPGVGVWLLQETKIKTAPRRQPDPVKVTSKEDCHASTRCYVEWFVDSNGGSPIREYQIRWRRIAYKDPLNQHINTDKIEQWSSTRILKAPITNYEIPQLQANSFYEVEVLARNDIGASASQPFRIRTLPGSAGESEAFEKRNANKINKVLIIAGSIVGALILFMLIDLVCLIRSNCGLLAILTKSCANKDKSNSSDYKIKTPLPKIAQHQPKASSTSSTATTLTVSPPTSNSKPSSNKLNQYQQIKQTDDCDDRHNESTSSSNNQHDNETNESSNVTIPLVE